MNTSKKTLAVVSTSYHLLVFLFLKNSILKDSEVDLVVTDKTDFLASSALEGKLNPYFRNVFYADSKKIKNPYKSAITTLYESFIYNPTTKEMLRDGEYEKLDCYDDFFFASPGMPDEIVKELVKTCIKRNKKIRLHRFEDGFASYTKPPISSVSSSLGQKLYQLFYRYDIKKAENELYLFQPSMAESNVKSTHFQLVQIDNTNALREAVIDQIKNMLSFQAQSFTQEYLFLGQGTVNGMNNPKTYRGLILEIFDKLGKDNFIVKPHPRGEHDKFPTDVPVFMDPCPFELALASGKMDGKTFISYYSTACVSAPILFHADCKIIFLYALAGDSFNEKCDYEDYFGQLSKISDKVFIPRTKEQLWELLK